MTKRGSRATGTLVLDSQGFALVVEGNDAVMARLAAARRRGADVVASGMTVLEAVHPRTERARVDWVMSVVDVVAPSMRIVKAALDLLAAHRLRGHEHAIDAVVAATALLRPGPVVMLTSDPDDMRKLCADVMEIVHV